MRGRRIRSRYSLAAPPPSNVELTIAPGRITARSPSAPESDLDLDLGPEDVRSVTLHFAQPLLWRMVTYFRFELRDPPDVLFATSWSGRTHRALVEHGWSPRIAGPWTFARYRAYRVGIVLALGSLLLVVPWALS